MKFKILTILFCSFLFMNCNFDGDEYMSGPFSIDAGICTFITCEGVFMSVKKEGEAYKKMEKEYLELNVEGKPVLAKLKGEILKSESIGNDLEIKTLLITSYTSLKKVTCSGKKVNY